MALKLQRAESQLGILSPLGNPEDFALDQNYFVKPVARP